MNELSKGANTLIAPSGDVSVELAWQQAPAPIDLTCFLVREDGKVLSDEHMVFYNQPSAPGGAVAYAAAERGGRFQVFTDKLPAQVEKCVFTATLDGPGTFKQVEGLQLQAAASGGGGRYRLADVAEERAVILAELYRHASGWKLRAVGQGFNGGLAPLARHFGVVIEEEPAAPSAPTPSAPAKSGPVNLTKRDQSARISLEKKTGNLIVRAQWIDNGDARDDNDDLDLRAGVLAPDGRVYWVACSHPGSLDRPPYARHGGDVQSASKDRPGEESIEVNPDVFKRFGGKVGMVFSVYSAVSNGAVSIASLSPRMVIEYGDQRVECSFDFSSGPAAQNPNIYTYVIGVAEFEDDGVRIRPSGMVSKPGSENTPWIEFDAKGVAESMDGPPVFKQGSNAITRALSLGNKRKYSNV